MKMSNYSAHKTPILLVTYCAAPGRGQFPQCKCNSFGFANLISQRFFSKEAVEEFLFQISLKGTNILKKMKNYFRIKNKQQLREEFNIRVCRFWILANTYGICECLCKKQHSFHCSQFGRHRTYIAIILIYRGNSANTSRMSHQSSPIQVMWSVVRWTMARGNSGNAIPILARKIFDRPIFHGIG